MWNQLCHKITRQKLICYKTNQPTTSKVLFFVFFCLTEKASFFCSFFTQSQLKLGILSLWPSRPISVAPNPTFKIFILAFDTDCEGVPLQLPMEVTDLQSSKDLKSKFLSNHILISRRTTCFHLDNSLTLSPTLYK